MSRGPPADPLNRLRTSLAGRYDIERVVGRGGMATVYVAHDRRHNRQVAIKVLHEELALVIGPDRFLREIEILAGLAHPNVLPLHDSGDADGLLYYVMPFVEGESLRERVEREGQLPIADALRIATEVADALAHAHSKGVIHRDIKPANIMIEAGHAVVADFGIAFMAREIAGDRLTSSGFSPGTPRYMSPEQASGESDVDGRSDIYSLGCVLYEMLSGDPPYAGYSRQVILARKMLEPVPGLRAIRPTVSAALEKVTLTALSRSAADRFRTAADFAHALDRAALEQRRAEADGIAPLRLPDPDVTEEVSEWHISGRVRFVGALLLLTVIGLINCAVYDVKMQMPDGVSLLRKDLAVIGARALIPGLIFCFVMLVTFVALKFAGRLLVLALRRAPRIGPALEHWTRQTSERMRSLRENIDPMVAAEVFLVVSVLVSIPVLLFFEPLLSNLWSAKNTAGLSAASRPLHWEFTFGLTLLVVCLFVAWRGVFRFVRSKRIPAGRVALARWGSLAWILFLVLIVTAPWRLIWHNDMPRVLAGGERAYILREQDDDLVIYNAERGVTQSYRIGEQPSLDRLGTVGYVFETKEQFEEAKTGR
jgi:Protein kinase domain